MCGNCAAVPDRGPAGPAATPPTAVPAHSPAATPAVHRLCRCAGGPGGDRHRLGQRRWTVGDGHRPHQRQGARGDVGGRLGRIDQLGLGRLAYPLLHRKERAVECQHLGREGPALPELVRAAPAVGPPAGGDGLDRHAIFSTLTRKALNSGVREFASPTNGVSALASQCWDFSGYNSAEMPTKPQWMGIPICQTFLPPRSSSPSRWVTMARTSILPRFDLTRTMSPFLMPFSWARPTGSSTNASGCSCTRWGTCCVM